MQLAMAAFVLIGAAVLVWAGWSMYRTPDTVVDFSAPEARELVAVGADEVVYRIDPTSSKVTYTVAEKLAGVETEAVGSTRGVAGDIMVDTADPADSMIGEILINIEQFRSDNNLRDRRIRHEYLESTHHPLAIFTAADITGLPPTVEAGEAHSVEVTGDLMVKETTAPITWTGEVEVVDDTLIGSLSTTVLMSTYDVGPISIMGLVSTGDEVTLEFEFVARDVASNEIPAGPDAPVETEPGEGPSFEQVIAPILSENCAGCHTEGGVGFADVPLVVASDAADIADGLGVVTQAGYMPPWPASDMGVALRHERGLTDDQLSAIADWADAGGPLDVNPDTPIEVPDDSDEPSIRVDAEAQPPEAYAGDGSKKDDYRCLIFDPGFTEDTMVTGYEFIADRTDVVHHALFFKVPAESRGAAESIDGSDGRPGWNCDVSPGIGNTGAAGSLDGMIDAWVPGQRAADHDGAGYRFEAGDFVVAQIHYHYEHDYPEDRSTMRFQTEPFGSVDELETWIVLAPVEIPCTEGVDTGPLCERAAALASAQDTFGPIAGVLPNVLHRVCGTSVEDFADDTKGLGHSTCDSTVRQPAEIVDVFGHMHELGSSYRMTLNPDTPEEQILLDIPSWSFEWQLTYQLQDPIEVEPGDVVRVECNWDRSLRLDKNPSYLIFSEGTEDEMCFSHLTLRAPFGEEVAGSNPLFGG